jgi:glucose/arabinose dehydrogenase
MLRRVILCAATTAAVSGVVAGSALAAGGPPAPTRTNGAKVSLVASGLATPTAFAFGNHTIYEADGGSEDQKTPGGVFHITRGKATRLGNSPGFVSGLAFHNGTLYVAGGYLTAGGATFKILAWSGWNGKAFKKQKSIYTAPKGFQGFNGIAVGPNGRLYVGVDVGLLNHNDHGAAKTPYVYDILTMTTAGKQVKVYATGIRQPWQMAFAKGDRNPYVTNFGQDTGKPKNPPDSVLHVRQGDNYGFPQCALTASSKCKGFTKPFRLFAPHTDNGGIAIVGKTIYLGQFGFAGPTHPPRVVSMPLKGGKTTTVVNSAAPVMAIGVHAGVLYIGTAAGSVYRTKL